MVRAGIAAGLQADSRARQAPLGTGGRNPHMSANNAQG